MTTTRGLGATFAVAVLISTLACGCATPSPQTPRAAKASALAYASLDDVERALGDANWSYRLDVDVVGISASIAALRATETSAAGAARLDALEARTAAVAGDYGRATALARRALSALDARRAHDVQVLLPLWNLMQFAQGEAVLNTANPDIAPLWSVSTKGLSSPFVPARGTDRLGERAAALQSRAMLLPPLLMSLHNGSIQPAQLAQAPTHQIRSGFCGDEKPCADSDLLEVPLLAWSGQTDLAQASAERAAAAFEAQGRLALAGAAWLLAGDVQITNHSTPFELSLWTLNGGATQILINAGMTSEEFVSPAPANLEQARSRYAKALTAFQNSTNARGIGEHTARMAYLAWVAGDYEGASRTFARAGRLLLDAGDRRDAYRAAVASRAAAIIGHSKDASGYALSAALAREGIDYGLRIGEVRLLDRVATMARERRDDFAAATDAREAAVAAARSAQATNTLSEQLEAEASLFRDYGQWLSAVPLVEEAQALVAGRGNSPDDLDAWARRYELSVQIFGSCLGTLDFDCASRANDALYKIEGASHQESTNNRAKMAVQMGNGELGLELARRARDPETEALALMRLGRLKELEALMRTDANAALTAQLPVDDTKRAMMVQQLTGRLSIFALLALNAKDPAFARSLVERSEQRFGSPLFSGWERDNVSGRMAEEEGNYPSARDLYARAERAVQAKAHGVATEREASFNDKTAYVHLDSISFLLRHGFVDEGLLAFERFRSRSFQGALLATLTKSPEASAEALALVRAKANESSLEYQMQAQLNSSTPANATELTRSREEVKAARDALTAARGVQQPDDAVFEHILSSIQERLDERDTTLLVYLPRGASSAVAVLSPGRPPIGRALPIKDFELHSALDDFRGALAASGGDWHNSASRLSRMLLAPVADLLPPRTGARHRLGIVAFGDLHRLPFQALPLDGKALVQQYDVFYLPSLLSVVTHSKAQSTSDDLAIGAIGYNGQNLQHAETEAKNVDPSAKIAAEATREQFFRLLARRGTAYVAAHAERDLRNPFLSHIALADGDLDLLDLQGKQVASNLVVLSACNTGRGVYGNSDDAVDFATTFLEDGAGAVVVTGWPVDDELTEPLMRDFYRDLRANHDPVRALGAAQRVAASGAGESAHPTFWSAFSVVVGAI